MSETRYARSGDLNIAYQVHGDGPVDVVFVAGFISHLDIFWELGAWESWRERVSSFARLIVFDKRGTGLSDRISGAATVEERMDDVRAVMDAAGSERAALVGISEGGPMALVFAATYPDRTTGLVLWNTFATMDLPRELEEGFLQFMGEQWGTGNIAAFFAPHIGSDRRMFERGARLERYAATPATAVAIMRLNFAIDVSAALPTISAPTLILHRRGDPAVPFSYGRALAERIPGARFVELEGDYHAGALAGDEDDVADEIEEFLTGVRHDPEPDRVLATVLFTDIVGSTEKAAAMGDRQWHALLDAHDIAIRQQLERFRGREVKTTGDGFLATFDGPARAVRCATAIAAEAGRLGIEVRTGLHTGECEVRGEDLAGIAVHIGARVAAHAAPGEVLVSSTVRDLVAGSGLHFADRGMHQLKGVPGEWALLSVSAS